MSAPDRIWAWASDRVRIIGGFNRESYTERLWSETMLPDVAETIGAKQYMPVSPAREHAEELVGMVGDLIRVASSSSYKHAKEDTLSRARTLLGKL